MPEPTKVALAHDLVEVVYQALLLYAWHEEEYSGAEELAKEYEALAEMFKKADLVVLING